MRWLNANLYHFCILLFCLFKILYTIVTSFTLREEHQRIPVEEGQEGENISQLR